MTRRTARSTPMETVFAGSSPLLAAPPESGPSPLTKETL
jgi:hypothetical protein